MLYECYNENNPYDNDQIRADFNELYQQMNGMPLREMDQLYQAYTESHESDPAEIGDGFTELEEFLHALPLEDNNAVFNLCCRLYSAYERKAFRDGLLYGAHLIQEITDT